MFLWALSLLGSWSALFNGPNSIGFLPSIFTCGRKNSQSPKHRSQNVAFYQTRDKVLLLCHSNSYAQCANTFLQTSPYRQFCISKLAHQSLWNMFLTRTRILNEAQANVTHERQSTRHGASIYVSSPHSNCDFWLIVNEWREAFIAAKYSGNLGTCWADWRDRLMLCYLTHTVQFAFISSLRSTLKFVTHFCDSTS